MASLAATITALAALQPPVSSSRSGLQHFSGAASVVAHQSHQQTSVTTLQSAPGRRAVALGLASALISPSLAALAEADAGIVERVDAANAYKFSLPSDWAESGKPVKTHLHELLMSGTGPGRQKVGITIDPVKIDSLEQFGSLTQTTERVLAVEQTRDGVKTVTLRSNSAEVKEGEPTYYLIDYVTDSSRGTKIYLCKYCIANRKLYVMQVQCNVADYDADASVRTTLQGLVDSFKVTV